MPNTPPPTTTRDRLRAKKAAPRRTALCDFGTCLGADQVGDRGRRTPPRERCASGLKMYCDETTGDLLVVRHRRARRAHLARLEPATRKPGRRPRRGPDARRGRRRSRGRPALASISVTSACATRSSTFAAAKAEGLPISVGVTPHHLYLTDDDAARLGRLRPRPAAAEGPRRTSMRSGPASPTARSTSSRATTRRTRARRRNPTTRRPGCPASRRRIPLLGPGRPRGPHRRGAAASSSSPALRSASSGSSRRRTPGRSSTSTPAGSSTGASS